MEKAVKIKNLQKCYGQIRAVDGINLEVDKGELFGFLGVNGAGKSTTINMLCTLFPPTGGSAEVCGFVLGKEDEEIRKRIGAVYQNNCLDNRLTVKENLLLRGSLYERNPHMVKKNMEYVCEVLDLQDVYKRPFGKLSGGQKRRCEIARALMSRPELLFLDEPTTGLDPAARKSVWKSIESLRQELNMTVFLTTHYMEEAARASHVAVIDEGRIKEFGTPFKLKEEYAGDRMDIVPKNPEVLKAALISRSIPYRMKEELVRVNIKNTLDAIPLIKEFEDKIAGFEVIQGSMDDVFLNITGKELKEA